MLNIFFKKWLILFVVCCSSLVILVPASFASSPENIHCAVMPIKLDPFLNHANPCVRNLPWNLVFTTEDAFLNILYISYGITGNWVQTVKPAAENRKVIADFYRNYRILGPSYILDYAENRSREPINVLFLFELRNEGEAISEDEVDIRLTALFTTNEKGETGRTSWRRSVHLKIHPLDITEMDSLIGSKVADLLEEYRKDPQPTL